MLPVYADAITGSYGYPEKPWFLPDVRQRAFLDAARARGLPLELRPSRPADDADLLRFHTAAHLAHVRARCATNEGALDHGPTFARAAVERAATHVVGAVCEATRRLLRGDDR